MKLIGKALSAAMLLTLPLLGQPPQEGPSRLTPEEIEKLRQHGILVERLTAPATLEVESFKISELTSAERLYQGHHLNSVKGEYALEEKEFP